MKKILCYGDSNTNGFNPKDGSRYDKNTRWAGLLGSFLDDDCEVIEAGMNNRMGFINSPEGFLHTCQKHLPKLLDEIKGVDILILAIGTNDLQFQFDIKLIDIEKGLENLISKIENNVKEIILIPPVILQDDILKGYFKIQFDKSSILKSQKVGQIYKNIAKRFNYKIFDINEFTKPSKEDGLHYSEASHRTIAINLAKFVNENFLNSLEKAAI